MSVERARLRGLPAVDSLLTDGAASKLIQQHSRDLVVVALRAELDSARQAILAGQEVDMAPTAILQRAGEDLLRQQQPSLCPVINATGVIIHTNLGRAPLSDTAIAAMRAASIGYSTLEFDLQSGERGSRLVHAADMLRDLVGAEAALVVNNNASALVLILSALAVDKEVVISRGQLVEIGGGFRIPAIMQQGGAHLVEVGATNRTRIDDFADALNEHTAMLLRVHSSNFKQIGFVQQPALPELVSLAHERGLLAVDDLGSGTLIDTAQFGLDHEPTIQESLAAGVDLVCFSGDKLLGGPQAGIILGRAETVAQLKAHPLARALRVDKLIYAALLATLEHYRRGEALARIPVWQMISRPLDDIADTVQRWAKVSGGNAIKGESTVGGGSLPGATLPTWLLALDSANPETLKAALRRADPPIIARIAGGRVLLDPRTVLAGQESALLQTLPQLTQRTTQP
ncbi:MAG: L-seryl-tRNA(Sec) selenium transferase [Chloroflexi bacterium]|nr:L-seryl-tRNA(Sec) selenium transferase [Chloroflexota bacterium]